MNEDLLNLDIQTFSVVTPLYNQGQFIAETIETVLFQEGNFFIDYIIMDGGSTDNTLEVIKKYDSLITKHKLPIKCRGITYRWFSEKDNGQADAINKGFKLARGNILSFLNSDDLYEKCTFEKVLKQFNKHKDLDVIYGNAFYIDKNSNITGLYSSRDINVYDIFEYCFICQPTLFMKNKVFTNVGPFNIRINNSFDYEFWLKIYKQNKYKFLFLRDVLSSSRMYTENKTTLNRKEIYLEYFAMMKKFNKKHHINWQYGFAKETSLFVKAIFVLLSLIVKIFNLFNRLYSKFYLLINYKNIDNMFSKFYNK